MKKNPIICQIKYMLVILLCVVVFLVGPGLIFAGLLYVKGTARRIVCIAGLISIFIAIALYYPLRTLRVRARQDVEYDENGLSKRKGKYEYLSRKERDMLDLYKSAQMEGILNTTAVKKMIKTGPKDPMKELDSLIGLDPVKQSVKEMVARMEFERKEHRKPDETSDLSGHHMCFFGPPGTGKTTVARIMTSFLFKYGYISKNQCLEVDGNFLKAGAQSAMKTEMLLKMAYGGVLFIDEAYSLMDYGDGGDQVIATLIKQMEDARSKFVLIIAGYPKEMKKLIDTNPGFESRIKHYLNFPNYNQIEMREIIMMMARKHNLVISQSALESYDIVVERERKLKSFGNARTARTILDKAIDRHAYNLSTGKISVNNRYALQSIDFQNLKIGTIDNQFL